MPPVTNISDATNLPGINPEFLAAPGDGKNEQNGRVGTGCPFATKIRLFFRRKFVNFVAIIVCFFSVYRIIKDAHHIFFCKTAFREHLYKNQFD